MENVYKKLGFQDLNQFKNLIEDIYEYSISIHEEKIANGEIARDFVGNLAKFWLKWLKTYSLEKGCARMEWACLDWNEPSIKYYLSLGAKPMDEWTVYRLTTKELEKLVDK